MVLNLGMTDVEHAELKKFAAEKGVSMRHIAMTGIKLYMGLPFDQIPPAEKPRTQKQMYDEYYNLYRKLGMMPPQVARQMGMTDQEMVDTIRQAAPITLEMLERIRGIKPVSW